MNSRRSFLKLIRFAPAAPLAAKAAAEKAAADLAGVSLAGGFPAPMMGALSGPPTSEGDWKAKVVRFLAQRTLPSWVDEHLQITHRHVGALDPDIASKKSWSFQVKVATQRQRNIERAKIDLLEGPRRGLRSREFEQTFGVWI